MANSRNDPNCWWSHNEKQKLNCEDVWCLQLFGQSGRWTLPLDRQRWKTLIKLWKKCSPRVRENDSIAFAHQSNPLKASPFRTLIARRIETKKNPQKIILFTLIHPPDWIGYTPIRLVTLRYSALMMRKISFLPILAFRIAHSRLANRFYSIWSDVSWESNSIHPIFSPSLGPEMLNDLRLFTQNPTIDPCP